MIQKLPKIKTKHKVYYGNQPRPADYLKTAAAIGGFALLVILVLVAVNSQALTPATTEQVAAAVKAQGYEPFDSTQDWYEPGSTLESSVTAQTNNFYLNFFVFSEVGTARSVMQQYRSYILVHRYHVHSIEIEHSMANFDIYTIEYENEFTACIRVGSTVFFAESNAGESEKIYNILHAIGYTYEL